MKRSLFASAALCSALVLGCSKSGGTWNPPEQAATPSPPPPGKVTPEYIINGLESPRERATYLSQLSQDSKFNPKEHKQMLEKYSKAPEQEVAAAAKELADRAQ